jgi:hypothetical protein
LPSWPKLLLINLWNQYCSGLLAQAWIAASTQGVAWTIPGQSTGLGSDALSCRGAQNPIPTASKMARGSLKRWFRGLALLDFAPICRLQPMQWMASIHKVHEAIYRFSKHVRYYIYGTHYIQLVQAAVRLYISLGMQVVSSKILHEHLGHKSCKILSHEDTGVSKTHSHT